MKDFQIKKIDAFTEKIEELTGLMREYIVLKKSLSKIRKLKETKLVRRERWGFVEEYQDRPLVLFHKYLGKVKCMMTTTHPKKGYHYFTFSKLKADGTIGNYKYHRSYLYLDDQLTQKVSEKLPNGADEFEEIRIFDEEKEKEWWDTMKKAEELEVVISSELKKVGTFEYTFDNGHSIPMTFRAIEVTTSGYTDYKDVLKIIISHTDSASKSNRVFEVGL